jgi:hypothetical protein
MATRRSTRLTAIGAASLVLAACTAPSAVPVSLDDYPARMAEAWCEVQLECCTDAELASSYAPEPAESLDECIERMTRYLELRLELLPASVDDGRASYDAQTAGDCFARWDAASCSDRVAEAASVTWDGPCSDVAGGRLAVGESCRGFYECGTRHCSGPFESSSCADIPREGEACVDRCDTGLFCDSRALVPRCARQLEDGAACMLRSECQSNRCERNLCAATIVCDGR